MIKNIFSAVIKLKKIRNLYSNIRNLYSNIRNLYSNIRNLYSNIRNLYSNIRNLYSNIRDLYSNIRNSYSNIRNLYSNSHFFRLTLVERHLLNSWRQFAESRNSIVLGARLPIASTIKEAIAAFTHLIISACFIFFRGTVSGASLWRINKNVSKVILK